jgi:uridine phosphorylase
MPAHLDLLARPARSVILSGDPRRTFHLAQALLEEPRMTHLARGLWGYGGTTPEGSELTVQSSGVGGPSAVAVLAGLADSGVQRVIRVGSCTAEAPDLSLGEHLVVEKALAEDGSDAYFSHGGPWCLPDQELTTALARSTRQAPVASRYRTEPPRRDGESPAAAFDLQTAALMAGARESGVRAAAILVVSETVDGYRGSEEELRDAFLGAGGKALLALFPTD